MAADLLVAHQALGRFLGLVARLLTTTPDPARRIGLLLEPFHYLLMEDLLPPAFQVAPAGGYAQYLLYRSADRDLSVMAMAVASGAATPVHDHLAWGLVGVYRGNQRETVYRRLDHNSPEGHALLQRAQSRRLRPGDVTTVLPPEGDIHRIETISKEASVSLHVLGNDIGCQVRHAFDPAAGTVRAFRSGYVNVACDDEAVRR